MPGIVTLDGGMVRIYPLRLLGDVTGDGTVNIADISRILKAWELTDKNSGWNPILNVRLSAANDGETIDIKDVSRAAKNWELTE
jgi:hypothetical protein